MRTLGRRLGAAGLLLAFLLPLALAARAEAPAQAQGAQEKAAPQKPKVRTEELPSVLRNIRERSRIIVFLVWLWISIAALLYVLRLKIREVDRVTALDSFSPPGSPEDDSRSDGI
jgi:hypothetical protein